MEVQDQEDHTRITEPSPTPVGQEGARKQKPLKHLVRPSESKEEGVGYRPSANSKGWVKKLGDKARSVMRTSLLMEGIKKRNSHPKSRQEEQHQRHLGHDPGPHPTSGEEGKTRQTIWRQEHQRPLTELEEAGATRHI